MKTTFILYLLLIVSISGCKSSNDEFDAQGTFEAVEVIVSSELAGRIQSFEIEEGSTISIGDTVGTIDAKNISLQKDQVVASIEALNEKTFDVSPQVRLLEEQLQVQQLQLKNIKHEQERIEKLFSQDAATGKQRDDINSQVEVLQKQMEVTRQQIQVQKRNTATQNRGILSEGKPLQKRIAQLDDQIDKASIVNPVNGTILTKYAEQGEVTAPGKALYKIADLSTIILRAYITGKQLPMIKPGQQVKVFIDQENDTYKEYPGTIQWISDKAEFTPKTIQTKEERANLVYAIKVAVKNDGYLKLGMYGEIRFK